MPRLKSNDVIMTCSLVLNEHETEMLAYLSGFGAQAIAQAIGAALTGKYSEEQWRTFWSTLRTELESATSRFRDTREVFSGSKMATRRVTETAE